MTNVNTYSLKPKPLDTRLPTHQNFEVAIAPVIVAPVALVIAELWVLLSAALSRGKNVSGQSANTYPKSKIPLFNSKKDLLEKNLLKYFDTVPLLKASNKDILFLAKWLQTTDYETYSASVVILAKSYFAKIAAAYKSRNLKIGSRSRLEATTDEAVGFAIEGLLESQNLTPKQRLEANKLYVTATGGADPGSSKKTKKREQANATGGATPPDPGKKPNKPKKSFNKIRQQNEASLKELKAKLKALGATGDPAYIDALKQSIKILKQLIDPPKNLKFEEQLAKISELMTELDTANLIIKIFEK